MVPLDLAMTIKTQCSQQLHIKGCGVGFGGFSNPFSLINQHTEQWLCSTGKLLTAVRKYEIHEIPAN